MVNSYSVNMPPLITQKLCVNLPVRGPVNGVLSWQMCYGKCCCGLIGRHGCCRLLQVGLLPLEEAKVEAAKLKNLR